MPLCCKWCCCGCCCCCSSAEAAETPDDNATNLSIIDSPNGSLLIFVNPHSGAGKGLQVFNETIKPKLIQSKIRHELVVTERANHAQEVVRIRNDIFDFNAIIIVSGDGLIFEVINGILERSDGEEVLKNVAFGIVPTGSGNGLLASVFHARNLPQIQPDFTTTACSIISDLNIQAFPVNLTHLETDSQHFASFLSIGWGLLADIDIESERYRKILGSNRFVLGAFIRVFGSLRTYQGRLSFHEAGPSETTQQEAIKVYGRHSSIIDRCPSYRSHKSTITSIGASEKSFKQSIPMWKNHHKGMEAPLLEDSLPNNWTVIEDEFLFVYLTSISHIGQGSNYSPSSKLCDDRIQLTYALKKDMPSKVAVAKFLDSIERNGNHLEFDFCKTISVTSFRLEPLSKGSYIVVDGEVIETSKIQGSVSDLNIYVMSK